MEKGFILSALNEDDIFWFQTFGRMQNISEGHVLIQEGNLLDTFYIVLVGALEVLLSSQSDRQIAQLGSGQVLGEMSLVDSRPSAATVRALEDSIVLSVPQRMLSEKLQQDEGFAARFYRAVAMFLSSRLRSTFVQFGYSEESA
ncbi:MAG: cyclic nucleotide-binding domain-containing protein [Scytolyngbya sp. HA4215-MV1]|jgi:CRP-like cAMP-binding protein|nr:cyclic nucleotide-binding domain-containing protein [Scytolyngbya sp. HA4215-MV1]